MALHLNKSAKRTVHSTKNCKAPQCATCERRFGRGSDLNRHMRETHSNRMYSCPVSHCTFKIKRPGKVNKHLRQKHGLHQSRASKSAEQQTPTMSRETSGSGLDLLPPVLLTENNAIVAAGNDFDHQRNYAYENTKALASADSVLGSGQWVPEGDTERVQTPPQQLQLIHNDGYAHPYIELASAETFSTNDLLEATEMLNLGHDIGSGFTTNWSAGLFDDGWHLDAWKDNMPL